MHYLLIFENSKIYFKTYIKIDPTSPSLQVCTVHVDNIKYYIDPNNALNYFNSLNC
jgi:hypothetical protein